MRIRYLTTSTEVLFLAGLLASVCQGGNWQDYRNNNWDIFGYNLTTQKEFQITDNSYDQTNPAINGNVVVWQDNRNANSEIYAVVLDGPEVARCESRISSDVNGDCKIDFADFAIMASRWLECYLEPAEACW